MYARIFGFSVLEADFSDSGWAAHFFRDLLKLSIVWMLTLLAISSGNRTNRLKAEKEAALQKNLNDQKRINKAISRFVPNEFLQSLGKADITQIKLGDNSRSQFATISNMQGQLCMQIKLPSEKTTHKLQIDDLRPGYHVLAVRTTDQILHKKILVH